MQQNFNGGRFRAFEELSQAVQKGCFGCTHKIPGNPGILVRGVSTSTGNELEKVQGYIRCEFVNKGKVWMKPMPLNTSQEECPKIKPLTLVWIHQKQRVLVPDQDEVHAMSA